MLKSLCNYYLKVNKYTIGDLQKILFSEFKIVILIINFCDFI
jgi:hypothetical protein